MKTIIIGGVAGGMSAAARLRRLDESASIIVLEKSGYVSFANCGLPYHIGGVIKERSKLILHTPESLKESLNLDVRVFHEATEIDAARKIVKIKNLSYSKEYEESYDKLIISTGASPFLPDIPGINHPAIFTLRNIQDMDEIIKKLGSASKAVVVGGGFIGVEMAENLKDRNMEVELIELSDQILPPLDPEMAADLETHMEQHGVKLHLGVSATSFKDIGSGRVGVTLKDGGLIEADAVLMAIGVKPDTALAKGAGLEIGARGGIKVDRHMRTTKADIYAVGDAVEVIHTITGENVLIPLAGPANRQGRIAADNICGKGSSYTSSQGTAIVKVFDITAGLTGASEKVLKRGNIPFNKIYIHPSGHAGYYPNTMPMHIKLLFSPDTGKILGCEITGYDGVDKRLDIFATAIRASLTVNDLTALELAYAPPYSSAKDPVNMAGFVASNLLNKDVAFWYAEDYPAKTSSGVVIDVRGSEEYQLANIDGSINIPLGKLRERLGEIPRDKPVFLYCRVGIRSYLAYRILKQHGYHVSTLAGGYLTFSKWHRLIKKNNEAVKPMNKVSAIPDKKGTSKEIFLDCAGMQCPGPIMKLKETMEAASDGDIIAVSASDPGFPSDVKAWCANNHHRLLEVSSSGMTVKARIQKGEAGLGVKALPVKGDGVDRKTLVLFSGDLDKALAAFVIANGAVAMGSKVTIFFTFWGLNVLRKEIAPSVQKSFVDKLFGVMMPKGAEELTLSKMHMFGMGTSMMKAVMRDKRIESLPSLIESAQRSGVRFIACTMSMDVMGIKKEELLDGIELGGVATFLSESTLSTGTLFI